MKRNDCGYYHLWIASVEDVPFFADRLDKARFLSLLQSTLSPRHRLQQFSRHEDILSVEVSLLAYSLTKTGVHLLVHSLRKQAVTELGERLLLEYAHLLNQGSALPSLPFDSLFIYDRLAGPHEALTVSREIHLLHRQWRQDRYSSIGFYLDDRRGDWMSLWRLTRLYDNDASQYLRYLLAAETESDKIFEFIQT